MFSSIDVRFFFGVYNVVPRGQTTVLHELRFFYTKARKYGIITCVQHVVLLVIDRLIILHNKIPFIIKFIWFSVKEDASFVWKAI